TILQDCPGSLSEPILNIKAIGSWICIGTANTGAIDNQIVEILFIGQVVAPDGNFPLLAIGNIGDIGIDKAITILSQIPHIRVNDKVEVVFTFVGVIDHNGQGAAGNIKIVFSRNKSGK